MGVARARAARQDGGVPRLARLLLAAALALPAAARAHVRLVSPASRYGDEMKFAPCWRLYASHSLIPAIFARA